MRLLCAFLITISTFISAVSLHAEIINVPDDYRVIQDAMDAAEHNDTVLVAPGSYNQAVNFDDKALVVSSWILIDGEVAYVDSTIIDGEEIARVVKFEENVPQSTVFQGFTIQNSHDDNGGGGIHCHGSPHIIDCIIKNNSAQINGGGIALEEDGSPIVENCVIEGNEANYGGGISVSTTGNARLINLTIRNNSARSGGGISIGGDSVSVINCDIQNNEATDLRGGGINSNSDGYLLFDNCLIERNTAAYGSAFYSRFAEELIVKNCQIRDNEALLHSNDGRGSTIYLRECETPSFSFTSVTGNIGVSLFIVESSNCILENCTIASNLATDDNGTGGVQFYGNSSCTFLNSIVYDNEGGAFKVVNNSNTQSLTISYSCIDNGEDEIDEDIDELDWGEGLIDDEPLFIEPDSSDFRLRTGSPCIDAGDPDSPFDIDGSRADMGALPYEQYGIFEGHVYDIVDSSSVENARILTSKGPSRITDSTGFYRFDPFPVGDFDFTVSAAGYNDLTFENIEMSDDTTINFTTYLTHPEISISTDLISENLPFGDSALVEFAISNEGNGDLDWNIEKLPREEFNLSPWDSLLTINLGDSIDDTYLEGVVFAEGNFYISGRNRRDRDPMIYVVNQNGELISRFLQPNPRHHLGIYDLAYDHESKVLWGGLEDTVYAMSLEGDRVQSFVVEIEDGSSSLRAAAWDYNQDLIWVSGRISDIYAYTPDGEFETSIERGEFTINALAFSETEIDGPSIYAVESNEEAHRIFRTGLDTVDWILDAEFTFPEGVDIRSLFISDAFATLTTVAVSIVNRIQGDRLEVRLVETDESWVDVRPNSGSIEPAGEQVVELLLEASEFNTGRYEMQLNLTHNTAGGEIRLPVILDVAQTVSDQFIIGHPSAFSLSSYPNPFNISTRLTFSLPEPGEVTLRLFDIAGRQVSSLKSGYHKPGIHELTLKADELSAGVYLIELTTEQYRSVNKIALVK